MRIYDIIEKKRDKKELTKEEIEFFVNGYTCGDIPDYQASALLMAIFLNKMNPRELTDLTFAMANSSGKIDFDDIKEIGEYIVDKHSTGGVGDKVTLIVLPIVASLGCKVCKMSGRGLGFTGGTADKLESIVGYDVNIDIDRAKEQVNDIGVALISQSSDIALADKKIYSLRDVTATVESIDLIAASIMSKKIASGADKIVLEVTAGNGAFMKNIDDAKRLAATMVNIGKLAGIETKAIITSMDEPLGVSVGNAVEVKEVIAFLLSDEATLNSKGLRGLKDVVFECAAWMIKMAGLGDDIEQNKVKILEEITSKRAYNKFIELVKAQGGEVYNVYMDWIDMDIDMPVLKDEVRFLKEIHAERDGYVVQIDSKKIGEALTLLGGGRINKGDIIDPAVGFEFSKKVGSKVNEGDTVLKVLYNDREKFDEAFEYIKDAIVIENITPSLAKSMSAKSHVLEVF